MAEVLVIHGIRTNGANNIDLLANRLNILGGHYIIDAKIPHTGALIGWRRKQRRSNAESVYSLLGDSVKGIRAKEINIIAHSYGALIVHDLMRMGATFKKVWLFAGALDAGAVFPAGAAEKIFIIHNQHDKALRVARILPCNGMGGMGLVGYQGPRDKRVICISDAASDTVDSAYHHSHYFLNPIRCAQWAHEINEEITQ